MRTGAEAEQAGRSAQDGMEAVTGGVGDVEHGRTVLVVARPEPFPSYPDAATSPAAPMAAGSQDVHASRTALSTVP